MFKKLTLILSFSYLLSANVIDEAKLLNPNVLAKINQLGSELESKTGVRVDLLTHENKDESNLHELVKPYLPNAPYALLVLVPPKAGQKSGKVDIFLSDGESFFQLDKAYEVQSDPQTTDWINLNDLSEKI